MLKLRQTEAARQLREESERLEHLEALMRQIEQEDSMSRYDVVIKRVEALRVASVRAVVPTPPEQGPLWEELGNYLASRRARTHDPCLTLYHDTEYKERDWDIEACQPIEGDLEGNDRIRVWTLPGVETMACTVHNGPFKTIGEAYDALMKWIDLNGYRICGPGREVVLREPMAAARGSGMAASQTDPETVVEVQYPVEKLR